MTHLFRRLVTAGAALILATPVYTIAAAASDNGSLDRIVTDSLSPVIKTISGNPWVQGFLVILITFTIASLLTLLIFKLLRAVTERSSFQLDNQLVDLLQPPIYYTLVVIGVTAGISHMPLQERWETLLNNSIRTLSVIVWVIFLSRLATMLLNRLAGLANRVTFIQHRTVTLFDNIAKVLIFGVGTYAIFVIWQIDMTAWLASAGIVGIAIGFAAKDTLSNLFSGVFIIADAPYKVGDYIVLDNGSRGKVTNIGLRSTRLLTRDDIEVTIPNSIIGNSMITNQSGGPSEKMRVRLKVGVAYGSDIDKVKAILEQAALKEPTVCREPAPRVRFRLFGPSSLDFELLFWVKMPEERGRVLDAMNTTVYKRFREEGIEIPYAKQDLYIKGFPDNFDWRIATPGNHPQNGQKEQ